MHAHLLRAISFHNFDTLRVRWHVCRLRVRPRPKKCLAIRACLVCEREYHSMGWSVRTVRTTDHFGPKRVGFRLCEFSVAVYHLSVVGVASLRWRSNEKQHFSWAPHRRVRVRRARASGASFHFSSLSLSNVPPPPLLSSSPPLLLESFHGCYKPIIAREIAKRAPRPASS